MTFTLTKWLKINFKRVENFSHGVEFTYLFVWWLRVVGRKSGTLVSSTKRTCNLEKTDTTSEIRIHPTQDFGLNEQQLTSCKTEIVTND